MGDLFPRDVVTILPPQAIDLRTLPTSVVDAMTMVARADQRVAKVVTAYKMLSNWQRVRLGVALAFIMSGLVVTPVIWKVASWAAMRYYYVPLSTWLTEWTMALGGYGCAAIAAAMVAGFFLWFNRNKEWSQDVWVFAAFAAVFSILSGSVVGSGIGWLVGAFLPWFIAAAFVMASVVVAVGVPRFVAAPDFAHQESVTKDTRSPFLRKLREAINELNITAAALRHMQAQARAGHDVPKLERIESVVAKSRITIDRELEFVKESLEWGELGTYFVTGDDFEHVTKLEETLRDLQGLHLDDTARARAAIEVRHLAGRTS